MTTTTNDPIDLSTLHTYDRVSIILFKMLLEKIKQYPMPACLEFLKVLKTTRWYTIASDVEARDIWDQIRQNAFVTDLIMEITVDLQVQLALDLLPDLTLIGEKIGKAIDDMKQPGKSNLTDEEFMSRIPAGGMTGLFKANPWLVVCYLITRVELRAVATVMEASQRANPPSTR